MTNSDQMTDSQARQYADGLTAKHNHLKAVNARLREKARQQARRLRACDARIRVLAAIAGAQAAANIFFIFD